MYFCCYKYPNLTVSKPGDYSCFIQEVDELRRHGLNDKCASFMFFGVWIIYEDDWFKSSSTVWWAYGDHYETNVPAGFENKASSLRYIGSLNKDWKSDSLTLYFRSYFVEGNPMMMRIEEDRRWMHWRRWRHRSSTAVAAGATSPARGRRSSGECCLHHHTENEGMALARASQTSTAKIDDMSCTVVSE